MKAIETKYKGYRFRSRLEARWAVFFDVMGIKYEYEPEGYDLGNLGYYLPDFYLPEFNCWVEVKGDKSNFENDLDKLVSLCHSRSSIGLMLGGDPVDSLSESPYFKLVCGDVTDSTGGECIEGFLFCRIGKTMILPESVYDGARTRDYFTVDLESEADRVIDMPESRDAPKVSFVLAKLAAEEARSARFEHGESGGDICGNKIPEKRNKETHLPQGWYAASISNAELKTSRSGNGQYINVRYVVTKPTYQGDYQGRVVSDIINVTNRSRAAESFGHQKFSSLLRAIGLTTCDDTDQLVGASCAINLIVTQSQQYGIGNEIREFRPIPQSLT